MLIEKSIKVVLYSEEYSVPLGEQMMKVTLDVQLGGVRVEEENICRADYSVRVEGTVSTQTKSFQFQWDGVSDLRGAAESALEASFK